MSNPEDAGLESQIRGVPKELVNHWMTLPNSHPVTLTRLEVDSLFFAINSMGGAQLYIVSALIALSQKDDAKFASALSELVKLNPESLNWVSRFMEALMLRELQGLPK